MVDAKTHHPPHNATATDKKLIIQKFTYDPNNCINAIDDGSRTSSPSSVLPHITILSWIPMATSICRLVQL
jgi:hypothetical protein